MANSAKVMSSKVVTGKVRLSFANLFVPRSAADGQEPKYSVSLLIPKNDKETLQKINDAIEAVKAEYAQKFGGKLPSNFKSPVRDGDLEKADLDGYAGHYFLNCSSKMKPVVVDKTNQPVIDPSEVYSGCYARASINFYSFSVSGNKGIACGLNGVQKLADGEQFGGGRTKSDFAAVEDDDLLA